MEECTIAFNKPFQIRKERVKQYAISKSIGWCSVWIFIISEKRMRMLCIIYSVSSKISCYSLNFRTPAVIFLKMVSRNRKIAMRYWMKAPRVLLVENCRVSISISKMDRDRGVKWLKRCRASIILYEKTLIAH